VVTDKLTVNGRVTRSSGRSTTWINGAAENEAYRSRDPGRVEVSAGEGAPTVPLKVGQTWDKVSGTISDRLRGGKVELERPPRSSR